MHNKTKTPCTPPSLPPVGEAVEGGFLSVQDQVLEVKMVSDFGLATEFQPANSSVSFSP